MKKNKGITMIALIITIIILLILAGVSIALLTGENGLVKKAELAKQKSEEAELEENETLGDYENKIGEYIYSTKQDNINTTWKKYMMNDNGYITGREINSLPEKFSELYIEVEFEALNIIRCYSFNVLYENLYDDKLKVHYSGFNNNGGKNMCSINVSKSKVELIETYFNNTDITSQSKMKIFYK